MIKHKFHLTFLSTELGQAVQFEKLFSQFKNININPIYGKKSELIIGIENAHSVEDSFEEAEMKANDLVDRLALLDQNVITLEYVGGSDGNNMSVNLIESSSLNASLTSKIADPLKFFGLKENIKAFSNQYNSGPKRVYRHTLEINDDISKYLIYYGLLQILVHQEQKVIDNHLKRLLPGIQMVAGKFRKETIITRIRNMIAHPESLDMKEISSLVRQNIESLRKIVVTTLMNGKHTTHNI